MFVRGIITVPYKQGITASFYDEAMSDGVQVLYLHAEKIILDGVNASVVTFEFSGDEKAVNIIYDRYVEKYPNGKLEIRNHYRDRIPKRETDNLGKSQKLKKQRQASNFGPLAASRKRT